MTIYDFNDGIKIDELKLKCYTIIDAKGKYYYYVIRVNTETGHMIRHKLKGGKPYLEDTEIATEELTVPSPVEVIERNS